MKNLIIALSLIVVCALAAVAIFNFMSPKETTGCANIEKANIELVKNVISGESYDFNSPDIVQTLSFADSCKSILTGKDASMGKCKAALNLNNISNLIYLNGTNKPTLELNKNTLNYFTNLKSTVDGITVSSCEDFDSLKEGIDISIKTLELQKKKGLK